MRHTTRNRNNHIRMQKTRSRLHQQAKQRKREQHACPAPADGGTQRYRLPLWRRFERPAD